MSQEFQAMTIIELDIENVRRIEALAVAPDGTGLVQVTGPNGSGKSSVLDAIEYALRGGTAPSVTKGKERARVVMDLGEIVVRRTWSAKGSQLVVENKDGARFGSPQDVLNRLLSKVAFDPLAFSRMDAKAQAAQLRELCGIDTTALDAKRQAAYEKRTEVARDAKKIEGALALRHPIDPAAKRVSTEDMAAELTAAREADARRSEARSRLEGCARDVDAIEKRLTDVRQAEADVGSEIDRLKARLDELFRTREALQEKRSRFIEAQKKAQAAFDAAPAGGAGAQAILDRINQAGAANAKVDYDDHTRTMQAELAALRAEAEGLTAAMAAIDAEKAAAMKNATMPIEGLELDPEAGIVTYRGLPLADASSAEQIGVSAAIGMALNPTIRVMMVREGSLMDEAHREALRAMATKAGVQVWYERVSDAEDATVTIIEARTSDAPTKETDQT